MNFAGRFWVGALSFVATPLYVRWLGVEGYGVVGFYLLLLAITGFFSSALMDAANREIAANDTDPARVGAVVVGFGRVAWVGGVLIGVVVLAASHGLASHWLSVADVDIATATRSIRLMALLLGVQVPLDFYVGALLGLRRHPAANVVFAGTATLRVAAAVVVLVAWSRTLDGFFWAQIGASAVMVVVGEFLVRHGRTGTAANGAESPWAHVRRSLRFSAGMTAVALTGMLLSQADRIVLSRALRLDEFGVYSLATTLANLLYFLISPVRAAYYSEFSRHSTPDQQRRLSELYHQACHRMAVLVMPAGAILLLFSRDLVEIWTHRPDLAAGAAPVVMFLVAARIISGINSLPYTLQYAHGWTGLVARGNVGAIVLLLPLLYWLALRFGATGAAAGYFVLSLPFLALIVWRMHRRLLPGEGYRWLWPDTVPPLLTAFLVAGAWKLLEPSALGFTAEFFWVAAASVCTLGVVVWSSASLRPQLRALWRARFS